MPRAHTLVYGPTEAVVVDPPITVAQGDALADWITSLGVRLTAVYLTHWQADHWLSTVRLLARFPAAQVHASVRDDTTVLHVPSLALVAAGDVP